MRAGMPRPVHLGGGPDLLDRRKQMHGLRGVRRSVPYRGMRPGLKRNAGRNSPVSAGRRGRKDTFSPPSSAGGSSSGFSSKQTDLPSRWRRFQGPYLTGGTFLAVGDTPYSIDEKQE